MEAPHPLERPVCVVTFDEVVTFYELTPVGRFRAVVMPDLEDPFLPVNPEALGVHLQDPEQKESFLELLAALQKEYAQAARQQEPVSPFGKDQDPFHLQEETQDVASTAVLRTSVQALTAMGGGDVVLFQATVAESWVGESDSAAEDDDPLSPKTPKTPKTPMGTPLRKKKRSFLEQMHRTCCRTGVAVSAVTVARDGCDSTKLHWLPWRTGGDVLHMPSLGAGSGQNMAQHLQHWMRKMQGSAYNCVVKLRCSKGLSCKSLLAPWPAAASSGDQSAFEAPRLSPEMSVTFILRPEIDPDQEEDYVRIRERKSLFVQAAILYTNSKGERLLRTHTRSLTVPNSVRQLYQSVNLAPLMTVLLKQAVAVALDPTQSAKLPRDLLLESCIQILGTFRRRCVEHATKNCLVTNRQLLLFPLYVLAARKLLYALTNSKEDKAQVEESLHRILRMPIHSVMVALYPRVYPLPADSPEGVDLPRASAALEDVVTRGAAPAHLITNGLGMWYHQTGFPEREQELRGAASELAQRIREVLQPSQDWVPLTDLPRLPTAALEEKIGPESTPNGRPRYGSRTPGINGSPPSLPIGKGAEQISWPEKVMLSAIFVEDAGVTEGSYADWVIFLQEQIAQRVSESS